MLEKVILPSGEPVEYRYDGAGRLTGRKTADGEDLFVQTGWDIVEKRSSGQDRHSQYPQGAGWQGQGSQEVDWQGVGLQGQNREGQRTYYTGLSSIKEGDKVRYYLYNHRGDTVLVTGGDGEIIHNLSYEAYGKATDKLGYPAGSVNIETGGGAGATSGGVGSSGGAGATSGGAGSSAGSSSGGRGSVFPQLFAGAYGIRYDAKTNLHYMRYRWYSQTQMRFVSLDLIRNANRYSYTNDNPIMYVDPTGLKEVAFYQSERYIKVIVWHKYNYTELRAKAIPISKLPDKDVYSIIASELNSLNVNASNSDIRFMEIGFDKFLKKYFGINPTVRHCESWRDYLLKISYRNKLKDAINEKLDGQKNIKLTYIEAFGGSTEFSWNPYYSVGHHYVYLKFTFNNNTTLWVLSETNAFGADGKNYGFYVIPAPDDQELIKLQGDKKPDVKKILEEMYGVKRVEALTDCPKQSINP